MSLLSMFRLAQLQKTIISAQNGIQVCASYATAKKMMGGRKGIKGGKIEKVVLPVETDTNKLVSYVCGSNIFKEGEDIKLKPDSEYPDWLWNLRLGPLPPLEELDPNTKQYWRRVRRMMLRKNNHMKRFKRF